MVMKKYVQNFSTIEKFCGLLIVLTTALLVGQHWGMMLSNSDDPWIIQQNWHARFQSAATQGRFWLVPINTLAALPYQFGSWPFANLVKIVVNSAVLFFFIQFCIRLTTVSTGFLMGLVWLALIDVSPGFYSPFHGFLLMFNLQFAVLFCSFSWYLKDLDTIEPAAPVVGPYVLFAFSMLAYEPMLFYAGVYPMLFLTRRIFGLSEGGSKIPLWVLVKNFFRTNYLLPIVVLLYIAAYFLYRSVQDTPGRGFDGIGNFDDFFRTVWRFSVYGFHIQSNPISKYSSEVTPTALLALAASYGIFIGIGTFLVLPMTQQTTHSSLLQSRLFLACTGFFVFSPNLLLGLVEAYRRWAADDPHYVGNYMSSFPLAMLVAAALISLVGGEKAQREKLLLLVVAALLATSATDNYLRWGTLAGKNRTDKEVWQQAIQELKVHAPNADGPPPEICGLHRPEAVSGDDAYWSNYLSTQLGRSISYHSKNLSARHCDLTLDFNRFRVH